VKKKYKPTPATPNEIRDCKIKLNQRQISKVVTGPKVLDFGQMTVFAKATKSFGITNELKQYIFVQVITQNSDVTVTPESQVIPPMASAGFDVTFCSEQIQVVQSTIYLSVNEHSKIKFVVMGDVVPTEVDTSTEELRFRFNEFSLEQSVTDTITLRNKGNSVAKFTWSIPNESATEEDPNKVEIFAVSPVTGDIPPDGVAMVEITYSPGDVNAIEQLLSLEVRGATSKKQLKCIGNMSEAKVTVLEKKIEYGIIPVGQKKHKQITLKNIGDTAAVFNVEPLLDYKIAPLKGRIVPGSVQKLLLELKPSSASTISADLVINIRGGKRVKVPIRGESKIPMVEMDGGFLNFGEVFVGSMAKRQITLRNVGGSIPAVLYLDFSMYSDFHVANEQSSLVTGDGDGDEPITLELPEISDNEDSEEEFPEDEGYSSNNESSERRFKFTVEPNSSLTFFIVFKPRKVHDYKFTLALSLAGIPPSMTGFNREVRARALKPRLVTSHHIVEFGRKVVLSENSSMMPHRFILNFTNEDSKELFWDRGEYDPSSVFKLEPSFGHLTPGQSSQIQLLFTPRDCKLYEESIPIYLDRQTDKSYFDVSVSGTGASPSLSFDVKEIVFPVVPLNITATQVFNVINEGYEKLDLKYKLPSDTNKIPLKLKFVEDSILTTDKPTVTVEISFVSPKPTSFSAKIDFFDNEENRFSLPVTCTADNCLLTTYPFLVHNKDSYKIEAPKNKAVVVVQKDGGSNSDYDDDDNMSSRFSSYSGFTNTTGTSSVLSMHEMVSRRIFNRRNAERLLNWLNVNILTNPVDDLIKTIQYSNGTFIYDIITMISGKKPPGKITKMPTNKTEACNAVYKQYEELLSFLKSYGALLNMIPPEYLMTYEEYTKIYSVNEKNNSTSKSSLPPGKRLSERRFRYKALEAWLTVLYQVIKIFVLGRINLKHARTIAGVPPDFFAGNDNILTSSNLYSTSESILLKWMTYHVNQEYPPENTDPIRIANFGNDLRDGLVLSALLRAHVPHIASKFETLKRDPQIVMDFEHNATLIVAAINEARLDYVITVRDLIQCVPRDMLLFCIYLFNTLPQYIPKTTIMFQGNLMENIVKTIELTNPTKFPIEYTITIEGSKEFTVPEDKITLKPKAKFSLPVEIQPKFSLPSEGRLTLHASRSGTFNPVSLVFLLQTIVTTEKYQKTIQISSMIYEAKKIEIEVENPFDRHAQFSVVLKQRVKDAQVMPLNNLPDGFWCPTDYIALKKGEKKKISIQYLPFIGLCTYECKILFHDRKVGEFIYCINAESKLPEPMGHYEIRSEVSQTAQQDIAVGPMNQTVDRAVNTLKERYKKFRIGRSILPIPELEQVTFKVEFSSPFFSGPETLTVSKKMSMHESMSLPVSFIPKTSGIYPCNVILRSDYDLRLYTIEGKAISSGVRSELDFSVPVRQKITQEIPLTNKSDKFWKVQATLTGDYFFGPNEIRVPPQTTINYPLVFYPKTICKITGELELSNPDSLEKYIYTLRGKSEEPLAEDKITINCKARETVDYMLNVPNISLSKQAIVYKVEKDLAFISGAPIHEVPAPKRIGSPNRTSLSKQPSEMRLADNASMIGTPPGTAPPPLTRMDTKSLLLEQSKNFMYKLQIRPPIGGLYSGTLSFAGQDGEQLWYIIEVNSSRAPREDKLTIVATIREASSIQLPITNPTDTHVTFTVSISGHGLHGENTVVLPPKGSAKYTLNFAPLQTGNHNGTVSFYNEDVGEFWYELELRAEKPPPIDIPEMTCAIGKTASYEISIKNPADEAMKMKVEYNNTQNFAVVPAAITLPPRETFRFQVQYYPSSINKREETVLRVSHQLIGEWVYNLAGVGQKPSEMDIKKVFGQIMRTQSSILSFKNPFPIEKKITVSLVSQESSVSQLVSTRSAVSTGTTSQKNVFKLMLKNREVTMNPFATLQIPFTFTPLQMKEYKSTVVIEIPGEDISWKYPILGVAEAVTTETFSFKCQSRISLEKIIQISIPLSGGVNSFVGEDDVLSSVLSGHDRLIRAKSTGSEHAGDDPMPRTQLMLPNTTIAARQLNLAAMDITVNEKFSYEVYIPDEQTNLKAIKRSLTITELKDKDIPQNFERNNSIAMDSRNLYFKVEFSPLRPFTGVAQLLIRKEGGGIFRYELQVESTSPEVDDIIEIHSQINSTESVSFRLTNIFAQTTPFEAYFTSESPQDFTVSPSRGHLTAYGYEGTQFVLSFSANHYGKISVGTLVIDTEEMQWRYEVRGLLPRYIAPKATKSKVQNRLKDSTITILKQSTQANQKKNFLKKNMKSFSMAPQ
jgi:hypothetical protein